MPVYKLEWSAWMDVITSEFELTNLLHRVASHHRTIKDLELYLEGDFPNLDTISVQSMLSNCKNLLPFTCKCQPHDSELLEPGAWMLSTVKDESDLLFDTK
ncbi:unnamed protein product [Lymnaea stagnalis]|uniref:Uncharacterized protein n=1 Tax=Lymnaea stagnalis TaxID=6523 RepID=A0AAV2HQ05_LYMST